MQWMNSDYLLSLFLSNWLYLSEQTELVWGQPCSELQLICTWFTSGHLGPPLANAHPDVTADGGDCMLCRDTGRCCSECTSLCGLLCQGLKMNVGINFLFILCHQNIIHPLHCAVISLKSLNLRQVTMKNVHHSWASVSWFDKTAQRWRVSLWWWIGQQTHVNWERKFW